MLKIKKGFTLAEMMVVMLIMSIILAAMAPVMTTRSKADTSSPWRYSPNNSSDAYFGTGNAQIAMIGQPNKLETDDSARLIINSSDVLKPQIAFKRNNTNVGRLYLDTNNNLILGDSTLDKITTGVNNISIGPGNLTENTTGQSNIAIGDGTLKSNTTGTSNTALGTSLGANTTGSDNTALGDDSLIANTTGSNNVAVGVDALTAATTASWNIAIGKNAYQKGTDGSNTIIGGDAMSQGTGANNVALGTNASFYGTGNGNVSIGANSNYKTTNLTTFTNSTAIGFSAYGSGANSVALGYGANATNNDSIAIGDQVSSTGESAIAIGSYASSNGTTTASASAAIAIGDGAQANNTNSIAMGTITKATSSNSVAIGSQAKSQSSATIALGATSSAISTNAIAVGYNTVSSASDSISIGSSAKTENSNAIAIGRNAYAGRLSGIAIGNYAKNGISSSIYGNYSIAIGENAQVGNDYGISLGYYSGNTNNGTNNIAIGTRACKYVTGSNKVCIGTDSGPTSGNWATDSEERVFIGGKSKFNSQPAVLEVHNTSEKIPGSTWIYGGMNGSGVVINGSLIVKGPIFAASRDNNTSSWNHQYSTEIGVFEHYGSNPNNGVGDHYLVKRLTNDSLPKTWHPLIKYSDRRLKYVGNEFTSGIDKIRQLKVYNYTFKKDKNKTPHVGVIAQDLQKVFPEAVKKGADGFLTIRMEDMFYAMINAIKELDLKYQAQEKRIDALEKRIEKLEAKIK